MSNRRTSNERISNERSTDEFMSNEMKSRGDAAALGLPVPEFGTAERLVLAAFARIKEEVRAGRAQEIERLHADLSAIARTIAEAKAAIAPRDQAIRTVDVEALLNELEVRIDAMMEIVGAAPAAIDTAEPVPAPAQPEPSAPEPMAVAEEPEPAATAAVVQESVQEAIQETVQEDEPPQPVAATHDRTPVISIIEHDRVPTVSHVVWKLNGTGEQQPDVREAEQANDTTATSETSFTMLEAAVAALNVSGIDEREPAAGASPQAEPSVAAVAPVDQQRKPAPMALAMGVPVMREPIMPEVDLLSSFAQMRAIPFLPPEVGTAVIFSRPLQLEPLAPEPAAVEPVAAEPVVEPVEAEPAPLQSVAAEWTAPEPVAPEPEAEAAVEEPAIAAIAEPVANEPAAFEPVVPEPVAAAPVEQAALEIPPPATPPSEPPAEQPADPDPADSLFEVENDPAAFLFEPEPGETSPQPAHVAPPARLSAPVAAVFLPTIPASPALQRPAEPAPKAAQPRARAARSARTAEIDERRGEDRAVQLSVERAAHSTTLALQGRAKQALRRDQPVEQLGVDIAAGQHRDHDLALDVELAGEQRRKPDGAAGLDHQLELAERERDRAADLVVAGEHALPDQPAVDLPGDDAGRLGHQRIADRAAHARVALALAATRTSARCRRSPRARPCSRPRPESAP